MKLFRSLDPNLPRKKVRGLCALAVMTKAPQAGKVKTRLVPPLTPDEAAELNKCFLRDTATAIRQACNRCDMDDAEAASRNAKGVAVYTPIGAESAYLDILPDDFVLVPQRGEGFGERLYFATVDLFQCGFEYVCLIDSDSPTVPAENFARAVKLLQRTGDRVVLGPSADGGYYLIGLKKLHSELFERIDWSTERVLDQTKQRAREIQLDVELLSTGYDVDDVASLRRIQNELMADTSSANIAAQTRKFLEKLAAHKKL